MSALNEKPGRREAAKAEKRARIREAALALFREKGIDATTTRDVADRAGIAAGTLFLYVRDKDDLVHFVFRDEITRVVEQRFASIPARASIVTRLVHVFSGLLEFYASDRVVARRLLREILFSSGGESESVTFTLEFIARIGSEIEAAVARREVPETKRIAPRLATDVFALYFGAVLTVIHGVAPDVAADDLRAAIQHALRVDAIRRSDAARTAHKPARRRKP
jgi:AcrR family transcriptional regulator